MFVITPDDYKQYEDMVLPEALLLEACIHEDLEHLDGVINDADRDVLQTWLTGVEDRIGHLTSLLVF
ncbi:hypothetical protein BKG71_19310 [Mycobacteroides chelonae]|uniref:hypothetical protein n=1 Tax=Mycobacteroides chelonae TaxID=1774 RepID=UPI0008A99874|nr:hypothetical protein [Mycobacteroides chelonae]OHT98268.1 hypothetical protein BKG71_19310 [Mycobacteroides chelonae]